MIRPVPDTKASKITGFSFYLYAKKYLTQRVI